MFPSAYLFILVIHAAGVAPRDELTLKLGPTTLDFAWSDAEDRIQGAISPRLPAEGQPLEISAHVGTFQGPEFDGPITVTLKPVADPGAAQAQTVVRGKGERAWRASFTPTQTGPHRLELSFLTSRHKVASGQLEVLEAKLSRGPWWILIAVATAVALGLGVRAVLKRPETQ